MAISTLIDYNNPISLDEGVSPSVVALADSAKNRLELLRKKEFKLQRGEIAFALSVPALMYAYTSVENAITGINVINPLASSMIAGMFLAHKPIEYVLGRKYFSGTGKSLVYNSELELVTRTNHSFLDSHFGFHPVQLGDCPFLLNYNKAELMPVFTGVSSYNGLAIDSEIDNIELILRVPEGVVIKEFSEGIGVVQREGKRTFSILAFAPLESIL